MRKGIEEKQELQSDHAPHGTLGKRLPQEILLNILSFLDIPSLGRVTQLSLFWKVLAGDSSLWKAIAENLKEKFSSFLMLDKSLTWKEKVRIKIATQDYPLQLVEALKGEQHLTAIPEINLSQRPLDDGDNRFNMIIAFSYFKNSKVLRAIYNSIPFVFIRSARQTEEGILMHEDTIQEFFLSEKNWYLRAYSIYSSCGISRLHIGQCIGSSADEMLQKIAESTECADFDYA